MKKFFCFIHIPKCGGLTFDDILVRNLGHSYLRLPHQLYEGPIAAHNIGLFAQESEARLGIGGHRISLDLPDIEGITTQAISFVRDPLSRLRSEFFYIQKLPGEIGQKKVMRNMNYPDYLNYYLTHPKQLEKLGGYQTDHLFGNIPYSDDYLAKVLKTNKLLLFPLERFDDACLYLEKVFPNYFRDASFVERNVNMYEENKQYEELEQALRAQLAKDNALYSLAVRQLDTNMADQFDADELLKAKKSFRRRCYKRKYAYHPLQRLTSKLDRATAKL